MLVMAYLLYPALAPPTSFTKQAVSALDRKVNEIERSNRFELAQLNQK